MGFHDTARLGQDLRWEDEQVCIEGYGRADEDVLWSMSHFCSPVYAAAARAELERRERMENEP